MNEVSRSKRVAWILYGALTQRTGGTIYDARIVSGLRHGGDSVEVFSIEPGTDASVLVRALARSRPDVVVGDELCFRELGFVFSRIPFTRRVLLVHHLTCWEEELPRTARDRARRSEAIAIRNADFLLATSGATRDRLVIEGYRGRIEVIVPGSDRLELVARPTAHDSVRPQDGLSFLFVGSIIPRKRVRELVRAFADSAARGVLRLAGSRVRDRRYVREIELMIEELGLGDRVIFLDELGDADLARELAAADVMVMPSSLEGYGMAATEAVRAGTPVIAARTAGLQEALSPCAGGSLLFDGDGGLAKALARFATNGELRASMLECASRSRMPSWDDAVVAFRSVLA